MPRPLKRGPMKAVVKSVRTPGRGVVRIGDSEIWVDGPDKFTDTLECGHVVVRYTEASTRRCHECAS